MADVAEQHTMAAPTTGMTEDELRAAMKDRDFAEAIANWHPTGGRVMLREMPQPEQTFGAIVTPDSRQKRGRICRVIAVGPESDFEVGTLVIMGTYQGVIVDLAPRVTVLLSDDAEVLMTWGHEPEAGDD